jgi:hypothetical protein
MKTAASVLLLVLSIGCHREMPRAQIEIAPTGEVTAALTEAALYDELETALILMYYDPNGDNSCAALVDEGIAALNDRAPLARQAVPLKGPQARDDHVFGKIAASGRYSFMLLGSHRRERDFRGGDACQVNADCASELCRSTTDGLQCARAEDPLALALGNVVAIGCEEVNVVQTFRTIMPVRLFPAGLR